jgi:hypothetical protein
MNTTGATSGAGTAYHSGAEEFEDSKGVIRIRKSKKNRQQYGQKKKDKQ